MSINLNKFFRYGFSGVDENAPQFVTLALWMHIFEEFKNEEYRIVYEGEPDFLLELEGLFRSYDTVQEYFS